MADSEFQQLAKTDRNPIQESRYQELLKSGGMGGDLGSLAAQTLKLYQDANKPAVEALQATIPTIGAKFKQTGEYLQKQATNLTDRYKNLLSSITGEKETAVQAQTTNTSQELGRRGISTQGGLFGETVNKAVLPIQKMFAGSISELGASEQAGMDQIMNQIAQLPISQTEAEQAVQVAIAQLQAGGNATAISNAISLYNQQKQNELRQQEIDAANTTDPLDQAMKELQLKNAQREYDNYGKSTGTNVTNNWQQYVQPENAAVVAGGNTPINSISSTFNNPLDNFWQPSQPSSSATIRR